MSLLCKVCDRSIIENEHEFKIYFSSLRKPDENNIYKKYVINNINLDELDNILNYHISTYNKKFDIFCKMQFRNRI